MNKKTMYNPRSESSHLLGFDLKNQEIPTIDSENTEDNKEKKRYIWDKKGKTGVRMKTIREQNSVDMNINSQCNNERENFAVPLGSNSTTQFPVNENNNTHCFQVGENYSSANLKLLENDDQLCREGIANDSTKLQVLENYYTSNTTALLQEVKNNNTASSQKQEDNTTSLQVPMDDNISGNNTALCMQRPENDCTVGSQVLEGYAGQSQPPEYNDKTLLEVFVNDTLSLKLPENNSSNELPVLENEDLAQLHELENNMTVNAQVFENNNITKIEDNMGNMHELDERTCNQKLLENREQLHFNISNNTAVCLQTVEDENMGELQVLQEVDKDLQALENNMDGIQVPENDKVSVLQIVGNESTIQEGSETSHIDNNQGLSFIISNVPTSWSLEQIHDYVQSECGPIKGVEILNTECLTDVRDVKILFMTQEQLERSKIILNERSISEEIRFDFDDFFVEDTDNFDEGLEEEEFDVWDFDPKGLYGLKPEFLESLNIKPPISNWVHVTNFRCEKSELRDAMEIAGRVLFCTVVSVYTKYAKVMYSHPLEAVQAVSMLDGQKFYGHILNVSMDVRTSKIIVLPKGLKRLGPGLGRKGKIITNIPKHYKRYIKNEKSLINPKILRKIDRSDTISHEKPEEDSRDGNNLNDKEKPSDEVFKENVTDKVNEDISSEEKQSENMTSKQDAPEGIDQPSPSQNIVSESVNSLHTPLLPSEVKLSQSAALEYSIPNSSPQMPRFLNPMHASLANLPPTYMRSTLIQNMYINCLHRPKPRTPIVPRLLDRFKSPRNGAPPGSSGYLPSIPESIEPSSLGSTAGPGPTGPTNVGFRPLVSSHAGCPLTGPRPYEIKANALETNRTVPISSGLKTSVTSQREVGFYMPTPIRFEIPISTRAGFGVNGSRTFGSRPLGPVPCGLGGPQPRAIEFALPVPYFLEPGVSEPTLNGFATPEPCLVGSNLPTPRPLWISTSVPGLLEPNISGASPLGYMPLPLSRPLRPSTLGSMTSGSGLLKPVPPGVSLVEFRPDALPSTLGPGAHKPLSLDPGLTPNLSGVSSLEYRPGGVSPHIRPRPLESIAPGSVRFESGLSAPASVGFDCSVSSSLESEGSETTSFGVNSPGSNFDGFGLVGIPPRTVSGPLWYSTSGTGLSGLELSGPNSAECQLSGLESSGVSLPPTAVSGLSQPARSDSRPRGFGPPRTRRSRQSRLSGFLPFRSASMRSISSASGPLESGSQNHVFQASGHSKPGSDMYRPHGSFKSRSGYFIPSPTTSDPAQTSRSFQSPARYVSVPEVKLDIEEEEKIFPCTNSVAPETSTGDLLTNLPPNTTLQMLCDNFHQYEEEIAKNGAHQMPGCEFTNSSEGEGCNHYNMTYKYLDREKNTQCSPVQGHG